jgi:hypothetical protein
MSRQRNRPLPIVLRLGTAKGCDMKPGNTPLKLAFGWAFGLAGDRSILAYSNGNHYPTDQGKSLRVNERRTEGWLRPRIRLQRHGPQAGEFRCNDSQPFGPLPLGTKSLLPITTPGDSAVVRINNRGAVHAREDPRSKPATIHSRCLRVSPVRSGEDASK